MIEQAPGAGTPVSSPWHPGVSQDRREGSWTFIPEYLVALKCYPYPIASWRQRPGRVASDQPPVGETEQTPDIGRKSFHRFLLTPSPHVPWPQARWFPKVPAKPVVALKTPIKVELVAGKTYRWCVCGCSKKQVRDPLPYCRTPLPDVPAHPLCPSHSHTSPGNWGWQHTHTDRRQGQL